MEQTDTTASESTERVQRSPELVRPVNGRMLAGVAQGIAENFGIHPWVPRVFFIVTAFFGGLGIALYAAGWAFIRSEDETESPADRIFSGASGSRSWIGIALIAIAGIIILSNFTFLEGEVVWAAAFLVVGLLLYLGYLPGSSGREEGDSEKEKEVASEEVSSESKEGVQQMTTTETLETELVETPSGDSPADGTPTPPPTPTPTPTPPPPPPPRPRETSFLGRLTIGVMLLGLGTLAILDNVDALAVDAQPRHYMALAVTIVGVGLLVGSIAGRARWLILLGVIMIPTLLFSPVFEMEWNSQEFNRTVAPDIFTELEPVYDVDLGSLTIDLRDLPWNGEEIAISAMVDAGQLDIFVPEDVGIVGSARVDVGEVSEPGRSSGGIGDPSLTWDTPGEEGTVILDAEVNVGHIEIHR